MKDDDSAAEVLKRHRKAMREFLARSPFGYRNLSEKELDLFSAATIHDSFSNENDIEFNYERLEFLGDAILEFIVCKYIYSDTDYNEGDMTTVKQKLVCNQSISEAVSESGINLDEVILTGKGHVNPVTKSYEINETMRSDAFEAVLGAVYLTKGIEETERIIKEILVNYTRI